MREANRQTKSKDPRFAGASTADAGLSVLISLGVAQPGRARVPLVPAPRSRRFGFAGQFRPLLRSRSQPPL